MLIQMMIVHPGAKSMTNSIPSIWGQEKTAIGFKGLVVSGLFAFTDFASILCHTEYLTRVIPHVITLPFCNQCQKLEFYRIGKHVL